MRNERALCGVSLSELKISAEPNREMKRMRIVKLASDGSLFRSCAQIVLGGIVIASALMAAALGPVAGSAAADPGPDPNPSHGKDDKGHKGHKGYGHGKGHGKSKGHLKKIVEIVVRDGEGRSTLTLEFDRPLTVTEAKAIGVKVSNGDTGYVIDGDRLLVSDAEDSSIAAPGRSTIE